MPTVKYRKGGTGGGVGGSTSSLFSIQSILSHGIFGILCLYLGLLMGMSTTTTTTTTINQEKQVVCPSCPSTTIDGSSKEAFHNVNNDNNNDKSPKSSLLPSSIFSDTLKNMVVDYATVNREEFNDQLEIGVPFDKTVEGAEDVLVLYTHRKSKPTSNTTTKIGLHPDQAFENCHTVKVILHEPTKKKQSSQTCIAIVPQWESYSVHKFLRLDPRKVRDGVDAKYPLRYYSRSHTDKGKYADVPSLTLHTTTSYSVLVDYLTNLDRVLKDLGELLRRRMKQSTGPGNSNAFIVMVCNKGQSQLLHNFVCNARAKGLDVSRVVMFATDQYTYKLCKELGIAAFYDEGIFGEMPETAARRYGDRAFAKMMMAKVFCVHLVISLGYDVLFQDVDVVWLKNPLEFFVKADAEWDMFFQDDGARSVRYQPYSPNTGMYEKNILHVQNI